MVDDVALIERPQLGNVFHTLYGSDIFRSPSVEPEEVAIIPLIACSIPKSTQIFSQCVLQCRNLP